MSSSIISSPTVTSGAVGFGRPESILSVEDVEEEPSSDRHKDHSKYFQKVLDEAISIENVKNVPYNTDAKVRRARLRRLVNKHKKELLISDKKENFLHFLASKKMSPPSAVIQKLATRILLKEGGRDLLIMADSSGNTPLHTAIKHNNPKFLATVSGPPSKPETVEEVRQTIERGKDVWVTHPTRTTFVHEAVASMDLLHDNKLLLALIALAPNAMLRVKDIEGRTPLHIAVENSRCIPTRIEIIRELISREPCALKMRDTGGNSVYQHHIFSTAGSVYYHWKSSSSDDGSGPSSPAPDKLSIINTVRENIDNVTKEAEKEIRGELILQSMRVMSSAEVQRFLSLGDGKDKQFWFDYMSAPPTDITFAKFKSLWNMLEFETILKYVSIANVKFKLDKGVDSMVHQRRDDAKNILLWLLNEKKVERILEVTVDDTGPDYHSNDCIAQALEKANVEILDWRRPDLCPSTLYKIGANLRELHLRWGGNSAILLAWSGQDGLPLFAKYGKLERIFIIWPKDSADMPPDTENQKKNFNSRLRYYWMCAVQPISSKLGMATAGEHDEEMLPDFSDGRATSDDTIALGLCPSPATCDHVHCANNLRRVLVEYGKDASSCPCPDIHHTTENASSKLKSCNIGGNGDEMNQHRWMQCMEDFTTAFLRVRQPSGREIAANKKLKPVHISLIDDGIDITNRSLQGKEYRGKSFSFSENGTRNHPYWTSDSNHGTIMTRFVRRICPTAEIYIIKVATTPGTRHSGTLAIDIATAIEAINHAVDVGSRIITMSWSIKHPKDSHWRNKFDDAVKRAVKQNIIMLCASSDQGKTGNDETYPYDADRAHIIRIGAATAMGSNAEYVDSKHIDFLFPGHDITLKENMPDQELGDVHKGPSVATAIAAGLAGMVLECVRIGYYYTCKSKIARSEEPITDKDMEMNCTSMKHVFTRMSQSQSRYIWVWDTFTPEICQAIMDGGRKGQWKTVKGLAVRLLDKRL